MGKSTAQERKEEEKEGNTADTQRLGDSVEPQYTDKGMHRALSSLAPSLSCLFVFWRKRRTGRRRGKERKRWHCLHYITGFASGLRCSQPVNQNPRNSVPCFGGVEGRVQLPPTKPPYAKTGKREVPLVEFSPSHDSFAAPAARLTTGPELRYEGSSRTTSYYRYHTPQGLLFL